MSKELEYVEWYWWAAYQPQPRPSSLPDIYKPQPRPHTPKQQSPTSTPTTKKEEDKL